MSRIIALALAASAFAMPGLSAPFDWPQWQGPDRTAHSKETGLLKEWPKEGPPVAWTVKALGGGDSTPSIAAGRIYGMANRGADEIVWALSEKDGKEVWAVRIAAAQPQNWPQSKEGPSCTPTVDGDRLYVMGLAGNVACLQAVDGKVIWQRSLVADFKGKSPMWSFRESPLVDGDKVICTPGGDEATMVALNKLTGETIWESQVPDRTGSGSARIAALAGTAPTLCKPIPCSPRWTKIRARNFPPLKLPLLRRYCSPSTRIRTENFRKTKSAPQDAEAVRAGVVVAPALCA